MELHIFSTDCPVANGTLCTVEHMVDINLGSILHFNKTAAELKQCMLSSYIYTFNSKKENRATF